MCVYANRSIVRYGVSKYSNASRSLAHYDREFDRKFEYTQSHASLLLNVSSGYADLRNAGRLFFNFLQPLRLVDVFLVHSYNLKLKDRL